MKPIRLFIISFLVSSIGVISAQSPGQPPAEDCKPGDFIVLRGAREFGPKPEGTFEVFIDRAFDGGFLTTEPIWVPSIEKSLASWSGVSGSTWSFVNRGLTDEFASFQDGKMTIIACGGVFPCTTESPPSLPPGPSPPDFAERSLTIAVTLIVTDGSAGNAIFDSDICFNPVLPLHTNPRGDQIDFETVLLHELGHGLGLGHNDNCVVGPTIMESAVDLGEIKRSLFSAEIEGTRFLYPTDDARAVRAFERDQVLQFDAVEGDLPPFGQTIEIYGPSGTEWISSITTSDGAGWVTLSRDKGIFPGGGSVTVGVESSSLAAGDYQATIEFNSDAHPGPALTVAVDLRVVDAAVGGTPPFLTQAGVVNGANLLSGNLAPGGLFTIFGTTMATSTTEAGSLPLPVRMGGAEVLVNSVAAPLLYVSSTQINGQIPADAVTGAGDIAVRTGFGQSVPVPLQLLPAAPELFLLDGEQALVLNQDGTVNSEANPAAAGSFVSVYLTGLGEVSPPVPSGRAAQVSPLSQVIALPGAEVGGQEAAVLFMGLAPGYVGLGQSNIGLPEGASGKVSVRLAVGEIWSNTGFMWVE